MYDTHIQTTLSIRGFLVFIEYTVSKEWAVEWWLNRGAYSHAVNEETVSALALLDHLLRAHEYERIEEKLVTEFEERQYAQEQADAALLEQQDISF